MRLLLLTLAALAACPAFAADDKPAEKAAVKPIKALLITGGCCHDYTKQKRIIAEGVSARAMVEWTLVQQGGTSVSSTIDFMKNPDYYKGFDIIVHNECFADAKDPAWVAGVLKPHREGIPGVVIHCAMHCYRDKTDEWFKFTGVTTHQHGAHYAFDVTPAKADHPILKGFPEKWTTPKGELYQIVKVWPGCTPLATAVSRETKNAEPCIWVNEYGKTRVFGTTVGHYNEEMEDKVFLNYLTRGLLWSCDKLNDDYLVPNKNPKIVEIGEPDAPKGPTGEPTPADPAKKK